MSAVKWSQKGPKSDPVGLDQFLILDSADTNPATENKRLTINALFQNNVGLLTAKGDLLTRDNTGFLKLTKGATGRMLTPDTNGISWKNIPPIMYVNNLETIFNTSFARDNERQLIGFFNINLNLTQLNGAVGRIVAPASGIMKNFRVFIKQNLTSRIAKVQFAANGTFTDIITGIDSTSNKEYNSGAIIAAVTKGQTISYEIILASPNIVGNLLITSGYIYVDFFPDA